MKKQIKPVDGLSPGERLDIVISKYFGKQNEFAKVTNLAPSAVSQYTQGETITKKAALDIQKIAGVNADYILNGEMPMMLSEKEMPYKEDASSIVAVPRSVRQNAEYAEASRGKIFNIIISKSNNR